ncbi:uncharacterized protein LOC134457497 [Engraulis encrasicolus]|uniref:uncharacterized protein LOC134457497 n=1 Tax=Engraulis encrasicolus TaxID=184585 RepID=UPI002FD1E5B6
MRMLRMLCPDARNDVVTGAKEMIQRLKFDLVTNTDTAVDEPPPKKKSTSHFADWEEDTDVTSAPRTADDEITEYLSSRLSDNPDPDNVLQWWDFNKERYTALSKLARFIFSIPASSAPSERAFRKGKWKR